MKCSIVHNQMQKNKNQTKTAIVVLITVVMMIAEILAGLFYGSIALLSDGIHMGTHTFALMITLIAYVLARKNSENTNFTFGTGKIGVLGGYSSAIVLIIASLFMMFEAVERFINPVNIEFNQSMFVAMIGLIVNLASAFLLHDNHNHKHEHHHQHVDHNLKAAYIHVIADALTSVCAIIALLGGKYMGWVWLDPVVGIVGALVVIKWGIGLLKTTGKILLDYNENSSLKIQIAKIIASYNIEIYDLHVWEIMEGESAVIGSIECSDLILSNHLRSDIMNVDKVKHLTLECI